MWGMGERGGLFGGFLRVVRGCWEGCGVVAVTTRIRYDTNFRSFSLKTSTPLIYPKLHFMQIGLNMRFTSVSAPLFSRIVSKRIDTYRYEEDFWVKVVANI